MTPESPLSGHTDYDLVCVADVGETVECCLKFNAAAFEEDDVMLLSDGFRTLTEAVLNDPDIPLADIRVLSTRAVQEVTFSFPAGKNLAFAEKAFPAKFAEHAAETPDRPAVEARNGCLTYRELDRASDAIAWTLTDTVGVTAGNHVAVMTGRDRTMIPAIIGTMKASSVFVPLAPDYPDDRVKFILEDSRCRSIIVSGEFVDRFTGYDNLAVIDADRIIDSESPFILKEKGPSLDDAAYIIYTSGSTGKPKGVVVEHHSLANFIMGYTHCVLDLHDDPLRIAFVANYVFDAAGRAFYPSLCRGDTVCIVDEETRLDSEALIGFLNESRIDLLDGTPSLCSLALEGGDRCDTVSRIVLGGEALKRTLTHRIRRAFPHAAITNVYGPTETTIDSTFFHLDETADDNRDITPIGRPLPNQRVYVLDDGLRVLPAGAAGEVCISGEGVARGYLGREELTGKQFVPDPFTPGGTLYRTGDLGYWRKDGNLIFLGRGDSQVKVRGFRIETGEIEAVILAVPNVSLCAVIVRTDHDGENMLFAYYTGALLPQELGGRIRQILPLHMIPDTIVPLERMPLTPSGKIDRIALMRLTDSPAAPIPVQEYASSQTERLIMEAMSKTLGLKSVSPGDNFFEIGGHSLKAARFVALLASTMGRRLPVSAIYRFPTPVGLANFADQYDPALAAHLDVFHFHFNESDSILFCFPPYGASGIVYQRFAQALEGWRLVCFNFLEGIDFVSEATRVVLSQSGTNPAVLLGYSGGGNLAFEVAHEVERKGGQVSRLIMLDSYRRLETAAVGRLQHEKDMRRILSSDEYSMYFPDKSSMTTAVKHGVAYADYLYSGIEKGRINAPVTLIRASDNVPDPVRDRFGALRSHKKWEELTDTSFNILDGFGSHDDMLDGKNGKLNGALVLQLLSDIP